MSSKDKTREKLMGSMRKTKADAGIESSNQTQPAKVSPATTASSKPAAEKIARATPAASPRVSTEGYQSGRRVWPD